MSLGIAFKGPEGIVLATDSRVTLMAARRGPEGQATLLPATFDNATKLLRISGLDHVGIVTYGLGALGIEAPRTPHSFLPEFEQEISGKSKKGADQEERLPVFEVAQKLSDFFSRQWTDLMPPRSQYGGPGLTFLLAGFDENEPYGKVYRVDIPESPSPLEQNAGQFGITWGGQLEYVNRIIKGYDPRLPSIVARHLNLAENQTEELERSLEGELESQIPYQFLPLQDCVDLSIFLLRTTMEIMTWTVGVRGVGGAIDVATITRTDGFRPIQYKKIVGQRESQAEAQERWLR